jgi:acyl dehydratase
VSNGDLPTGHTHPPGDSPADDATSADGTPVGTPPTHAKPADGTPMDPTATDRTATDGVPTGGMPTGGEPDGAAAADEARGVAGETSGHPDRHPTDPPVAHSDHHVAAGGAVLSARPPTVCWQGRFFEDFTVGDVYRHPLGRTVLPTDNSWLTLLTQNTAALHFDAPYARRSQFGQPLVDSTFTLALVTGQSALDVSMNVMANLGWDRVRLPSPVFEGDTIYSQSEVLRLRPSSSRHDVGVVTVRTIGFNQDGSIVITFERTLLVYRRGHGPGLTMVAPRWDEISLRAAGVAPPPRPAPHVPPDAPSAAESD